MGAKVAESEWAAKRLGRIVGMRMEAGRAGWRNLHIQSIYQRPTAGIPAAQSWEVNGPRLVCQLTRLGTGVRKAHAEHILLLRG